MKPVHFGEHLTFDGYGGSLQKLDDKDLILRVLSELPRILSMNLLAEPQVFFAPGKNKDPGGWSGFVVIQESHISLHTFPKKGFLSADVYTCQNGLNRDLIADYFRKIFETKDEETNLIVRGTKYPVENIY